MLNSLLVTLHIVLCVVIIALVLIQRGKGAGAGAGFGAGASGTVFGARGSATFFSKATAVVATVFFVTSLALTFVASRPAEAPQSVIDRLPVDSVPAPAPAPAPAPGLGGDEVPGLGAPPPAPPAE